MYHIANILTLSAPHEASLPIIYDSPHSGTWLPDDFQGRAAISDIRASEDAFVDRLFCNAPRHHGFFLKSLVSRAYIDLNRALDDIDPLLLAGDEIAATNPSEKSYAGHGLIWRQCITGTQLYQQPLTRDEITYRIDNYWQPYHRILKNMYRRLKSEFGCIFHLNCHSMPSRAVGGAGIDIVLGDNYGSSASAEFKHFLIAAFEAEGLKIRVNHPYSGAFLIQNYAQPSQNSHAVQIEINRALYMDEKTLTPHQNFSALKNSLEHIMAQIALYVRHHSAESYDRPSYQAAE